MTTSSIKEKIRKLLTLASSSEHKEEADLAFTKAQMLMDIHRISPDDISEAEVKEEPYAEGKEPIISGKRIPRWKISLIVILGDFNNCCTVTRTRFGEKHIVLYGRDSDIEHVRWIFSYCVVQLNTYSIVASIGHDIRFKNSWLDGAVAGIRSKLEKGRKMAIEQVGEFGLIKLKNDLEKVRQSARSLYTQSSARRSNAGFDSEGYSKGFKTGENMDMGQNKVSPKTKGTLAG